MNLSRHFYQLVVTGLTGGLWAVSLPSWGQPLTRPLPSGEPLDISLLAPEVDLPAFVVTANTISQSNLTTPSLWWATEQFGDRLITNWLAYPAELQSAAQAGRVDLVVNRQIWSLLDYLERYEFVTHMGTTARQFGYNTRVFNPQGELLAAYTCTFTPENFCNILLDDGGKSGLRGRQRNLLAPQ